MEIPRLSAKEQIILESLQRNGETYGLELVRESGGLLKRGTVYVTLNRMEEKGYVESKKEELPSGAPGAPRRLYRASGKGQRALAAWNLARQAFAGGQFQLTAS